MGEGEPAGREGGSPEVAGSLTRLVRLEAHRKAAEEAPPDPERVAAGWERRFVADGARAEEAVALYRELGFEAVADPVRASELPEACEACALVAALRFRAVYVRRPGGGEAAGRPPTLP